MPTASKIAQLFSKGPVTFDRFMAAALYDSECGYYSSQIRDVGRRGDFSTSATLHPILGEAIAAWIISQGDGLPIIEVGAGTGALSKSVFENFGFWQRFRRSYHIVEISPRLKAHQQKTLRKYRVTWHEDICDALKACGGKAHIFSNELVDAFPCRVFVKAEEEWRELALQLHDGTISETFLPASGASDLLKSIDAHFFPKGQRMEVQESYRDWLTALLPEWRQGNMLTIDYGGTLKQICHRRPQGSLRAYFHHQRMEGAQIYQRFGKQDITADVNFPLLSGWGETLGLQNVRLETQGEFLQRILGAKKIQKAKEEAAAYLLQEPGPGDAFRVLEQRRG